MRRAFQAGLLLFAAPWWLDAAEPVKTAWIMAKTPAGAGAAVDRIRPDVHSVELNGGDVVVRSAGISLAWLGPLQAAPQPKEQIREFTFRFPLKPQPAVGLRAHVGAEFMGAFLNGIPIYNQFEAASYQGRNLWHYDPIARNASSHGSPPGLIENLIPDRGRHSPIIGFALDGYPIYGPWGYAGGGLRRMRSSYRLRQITTRDRWPGGERLAPGQEGPPPGTEYPPGSFVEDYEYVSGSGDLDRYNGRFAKTPEYPDGTYAYYLTTGDDGRLAFPYLLAHEYYGRVSDPPETEASIELRAPREIAAGEPVRLRLAVPGKDGRPVRYLEHVHERPVHLMVVSEDLASFDHIHPEVNSRDEWTVRHTFTHGGRYRVYADFTPPGSNQRVESFDVIVRGPARPNQSSPPSPSVKLETDPLQAGQDVELDFKLADPAGLQPYLGAWAHVAIAGERLSSFIHAHPLADGAAPIRESEAHTHAAEALGPPPGRIRVVTGFPAAGRYKLWLQLQIAGKVETLPFEVQVAPGHAAAKVEIPADAIQVRITSGGYEPARIRIPSGKKVTLAFVRTGEPNCGGKVVFPEIGLSREIPPGGVALVEIPPQPAGELRFTCGMGMYRGSVVASIR